MLFQCQVGGCNTYWSSILLFVVSDCAKSCAVNGSCNFAKEDNFEWSSHVRSLELPVGLVLSNGAKEVTSVVQVPQEVLAFDDYIIDACFKHLFSGHHSKGTIDERHDKHESCPTLCD